MKHGKYKKALQAFITLQTTRLLASRDFMYAHAQLDFVGAPYIYTSLFFAKSVPILGKSPAQWRG